MVKQRFSTSDVAAEVGCLRQKVLGMRLANIYDINSKTYLLKLARSGEEGEKIFIVLESGTRFHTTKWAKDKADTPSNFTLKLRKHLRTRRLEDVRQLGVDRIIDFCFGSGEACHHLILELFSQGNVILTDAKYEILTLLRSHRDDAKGVAIMARHPYPMQAVRLRQAVTSGMLQAAIETADAKTTLRSVTLSLLPYGAALCDHVIASAGLSPQSSVKDGALSVDQQQQLLGGIQDAERMLAGFDNQPPRGYIWQREAGSRASTKGSSQSAAPKETERHSAASQLVYEDFDAVPLKQNEGKQMLSFATFDAALDEFYAKIEDQKAQHVQVQKESAVMSKVDKIRIDQTQRAAALEREALQEELKATLIEYNLEAVDAAIAAVRGALGNGLNWKELKRLIKTEREAGNPVASLVHSLELEQNRVTLLLSNFLDEEEGDDDAITRPATKVEIDLDLNAYANARVHFESRKAKAAKQQKTVEQNAKALKAAEKTAQQKLSQVQSAKTVQQLRKPYWFEKFHWFITSENYLVISGRDAQQNELLVKRYLRRGDAYVHAELHGASTTIVKNHEPDLPVPPLSLAQAGCACVCRSQAWEAKIVTSAWWVNWEQVSKTAPTGEYLPTGSFMIRGRKNFLPPQPLIMGLAFLFRVDESSLAGHVGERAVRGVEDNGSTSTAQQIDENAESLEAEAMDGSVPANGLQTEASALEAFMESAADPLGSSVTNHDRYGLSNAASVDPDVEDDSSRTGSTPIVGNSASNGYAGEQTTVDGRRHLSAKERRTAKKQGGAAKDPNLAPEELAALEEARKAEAARRKAKQQADLEAKSEAAAAAMRGKRGKAKKAQTKYAKQDEEDRQLALQLLDPAGKQRGKAEKKEARKMRRQEQSADATSSIRREPPTAEELEKVGAAKETFRLKGTVQAHNGIHTATDTASTPADLQSLPGQSTAVSDNPRTEGEAPASLLLSATNKVADLSIGNKDRAKDSAQPDSSDCPADRVESQHRGESSKQQPEETGSSQGFKSSNKVADKVAPAEHAESKQHSEAEVEQQSEAEAVSLAESGSSSSETEIQPGENSLQAETQEAAEVAALMEEEQIELLPEAELQRLREIDALTGQPREGDILLHALPVCAPYSALQAYKHRLKLTPGTQRKGKAGKQAVELMTKGAEIATNEKELIKGVPEMEVINAIVGSVKISMPGLQKIKNAARAQKKKKKKAS